MRQGAQLGKTHCLCVSNVPGSSLGQYANTARNGQGRRVGQRGERGNTHFASAQGNLFAPGHWTHAYFLGGNTQPL